jgi:hypothetical protein
VLPCRTVDDDGQVGHHTLQEVVHAHFDRLRPALRNAGHALVQSPLARFDQPGLGLRRTPFRFGLEDNEGVALLDPHRSNPPSRPRPWWRRRWRNSPRSRPSSRLAAARRSRPTRTHGREPCLFFLVLPQLGFLGANVGFHGRHRGATCRELALRHDRVHAGLIDCGSRVVAIQRKRPIATKRIVVRCHRTEPLNSDRHYHYTCHVDVPKYNIHRRDFGDNFPIGNMAPKVAPSARSLRWMESVSWPELGKEFTPASLPCHFCVQDRRLLRCPSCSNDGVNRGWSAGRSNALDQRSRIARNIALCRGSPTVFGNCESRVCARLSQRADWFLADHL